MIAFSAVTRRGAYALACIITLVLTIAFLRTPHVGISARAAIALLLGLSAASPASALLVFAGLSPFTTVLAALTGTGIGGTAIAEAMALATLAGWFLRGALAARLHSPAPALLPPALLFALIALCSALVQLPEVALQRGDGSLAATLWTFLSREYFERAPAFKGFSAAAVLLQAIGLMLMAAGLAGADSPLRTRVPLMMLAGAAGSAALNVYRLLGAALRNEAPLEALRHLAVMGRISMHYDRNAAGSVYAMMTVAGTGHVAGSLRRRLTIGAAVLLVAAGLWLTGSRVALAAVLAGAGGLAVATAWRRHDTTRRMLAIAAVACLVAIAVLAAMLYPAERNPSVTASVQGRRELAIAALRMYQAHPVFGAGIGRFYDLSDDYGRPQLFSVLPVANPRENAHNNFLQVLAELGVPGLAALVWLLWAALRPAAAAARASSIALTSAAGCIVYVLTWATGHPLLVPEATYPFFLLLGATAAFRAERPAFGRHVAPRLAAAAAVILAVVLPFRLAAAARSANLDHVGYGLSRWQSDPEVYLYRLAGRAATLFVPSNAGAVQVPLRRPTGTRPVQVELLLDGRSANRVTVRADAWHIVHMIVPPGRSRYRRVDFRVLEPEAEETSTSEPHLMIGRIRTAHP